MINDAKTQIDGYISFIGGQDAGNDPSLITSSQSAELWNATVRGGTLRPRPGYIQLGLSFPTTEIANWFETYPVQASVGYSPLNRTGFSVWSVGGRIFTVDIINNGSVREITTTLQTVLSADFSIPAIGSSVTMTINDSDLILVGYPILINGKTYQVTDKSGTTITATNINDFPAVTEFAGSPIVYLQPNGQNSPMAWMIQAEEFLIIQDGISRPIIFDGSTTWRSQDMPVGTAMAYIKGRVWIAVPGKSFVASDIVRSPDSGTSTYGYRDSILHFTENTFLAGGGSFSAPGVITAMAAMTTLDTSTGQGPLLVFTDEIICSVNAPVERALWAVVQNPIVTQSLVSSGAAGFYSTLPTVSGDVFFRTPNGIKSFYYAVREYGTWGSTPISTEVDNILTDDDKNLLQFTSAIVFDNRLLMTSGARSIKNGAYWKALVVLDFHPISAMSHKSPPVYDGVWEGIDIWWVFKVQFGKTERAFASVRNADGRNELWEITKSSKFDGADGRIKWRVVTRNLPFQSFMETKRLEGMDVWIGQGTGKVDLTAKYRPDQYPCWNDWRSESICVDYRECSTVNCAIKPTFRPGYKTRIPFGQPADVIETNDNKPMRIGYEFQVSLEIEGYCEIRKLRCKAIEVEEDVNPPVI